MALVLAGLGAGGWYLWHREGTAQVATMEREPNNDPATAELLPRATPFTAFLGKRIDAELSDADVYRIPNPGERKVLRVEVSSIPNMDILLEVVRSGYSTPVLTANGGGRGVSEAVANFPVVAADYYLRVREQWISGRSPTENVSDPYIIKWDYVTPGPDEEREVNDSLEQADPISAGQTVRGYIGWGGDVDVYCLRQDASSVQAVLTPPSSLDLVLRVVNRGTASSRAVDEHGAGEAERSPTIDQGSADRTCFEVSPAAGPGARMDADATYSLEVREVEP